MCVCVFGLSCSAVLNVFFCLSILHISGFVVTVIHYYYDCKCVFLLFVIITIIVIIEKFLCLIQ